jgi:hypothetical protein
VLEVFKEKLSQRTTRVDVWVPAEHVSPSHIHEHRGNVTSYESAHPWIYRVGLEPGANYEFVGNKAVRGQSWLKRFEYIVIGDCTTLEGLAAPYDEEITKETFEIESLGGRTVFEFWDQHRKQQRWTGKVERQQFNPT